MGRTIVIGNQVINVIHVSDRTMAGAGRISGTVFQALRYFGSESINDTVLSKIAKLLTVDEKRELSRDSQGTPLWIQKAVKKIVS